MRYKGIHFAKLKFHRSLELQPVSESRCLIGTRSLAMFPWVQVVSLFVGIQSRASAREMSAFLLTDKQATLALCVCVSSGSLSSYCVERRTQHSWALHEE